MKTVQDILETERAAAYRAAFPSWRTYGWDSLESRRNAVKTYVQHVLYVRNQNPKLLEPYHLQAALDVARSRDTNFPVEASELEETVRELEGKTLSQDMRGRPDRGEIGWFGKILFGAVVGTIGYGISRSSKRKK